MRSGVLSVVVATFIWWAHKREKMMIYDYIIVSYGGFGLDSLDAITMELRQDINVILTVLLNFIINEKSMQKHTMCTICIMY